ncbi:MAG: hypothetical protein K9L86_04450 [Candidatus Omnitrophica bacterium]|nr:hypothetical protein [Candidatus Omnitrophota bacterium]
MRKIIIILTMAFLGLIGYSYAQDKPTILVFTSSSCHVCHKVKAELLPELKEKYKGKADWLESGVSEPASLEMLKSLSEQFGREKALVPSIVVGDKMFVGFGEIQAGLDQAIQDVIDTKVGVPAFSKQNLMDIFKKFSLLAILGSGLADGVNPCAFAVIVFFISFLSIYGYKKREIIYVGISYCLAVFITYLLIGLGVFEFFYSLGNITFFIKWFYYVVGFFCFFMGIFAIYDYIHFKITKKSEGALLQLPKFLKKKINLTIGSKLRDKKKDSLWGLAITSFSVGFMVSLLEAACTGQLYLPTIVFVLKSDQLRLRAWFYLVLYNLMFIFPLVIVFILSLVGVGSQKFNNFLKKNVGLIKLIMAFVFFVLGSLILIFN